LDFHSHNSVAVLTFPTDCGYPRLTRSVQNEVAELLESIRRESLFEGLVIAANSESFATGADIEELAALDGIAARECAQMGQSLFDQIERFPVPVVAAIRGFCLGGGLDLALACHARVATYDSSFGHPGGSLGLLTGWGGTQRLPRLVGKAQALQILLTGERIPATQALTLGLVDELVASHDLLEAAARRARQLAATGDAASVHWLRT
jgi:3-hydroxyacyl-CoA dehydrogenase/enoyl-CoA hydratase/3-hydroxybutyryl-CoA epimerase